MDKHLSILERIDQLERNLQDHKQFIFNLVDYRHFACFVWDYEGSFVYANQQACDLLGYNIDDIVGAKFTDLIYSEDVKRSMDVYKTNTESGIALSSGFMNRYIKKDGSLIWLRWERAFNNDNLQMGAGEARQATEEETIEQIGNL